MKTKKTEVNRIIKASECKTGNLTEYQKAKARFINEHPSFDAKSKPYRYVKNFKTNTSNHGWLFEFKNKIFAGMQIWIPRLGEVVIIFNATQKGGFSIAKSNEVTRYISYVDIEAAVDKFAIEFKDI